MLDVLLKQHRTRNGTVESDQQVIIRTDKPVKSFLKSLSWRIVGTLDTMIISYFITGRMSMALSIGSVEVITKTILYYFHERLWVNIHKIRFKFFSKNNGGNLEIEEHERTSLREFRFGKS
jgi:uncharacterized membrane protein